MNAILRTVEPAAVAGEPIWLMPLRRVRQALLRTLDGLAPARRRADYQDLPPEWYEFPPF